MITVALFGTPMGRRGETSHNSEKVEVRISSEKNMEEKRMEVPRKER